MRAAVIGSPVSHSLSPAIFKFISMDQGIEIDYSSIEVTPEECKTFISQSKEARSFVGRNVTLPLKELVSSSVDHLSRAAKMIGAVNVLHFYEGEIFGHNTDVIGIEKTLGRYNFQLKGKDCLLWGAGGAAKAAAYVLGKMKARQVYVSNRGTRGEELSRNFSQHFPDTGFKAISDLEELKESPLCLMINATSLGMQGKGPGLEYFIKARHLTFEEKALSFDLIYIPEDTDFLKVSSELGLRTAGGMGMLIDQAMATWEIWIAPIKEEERLHQKLKTFLKGLLYLRYNSSPVYLTGFMGVGKSTIAQRLAQLTKRELIETDSMIEAEARQSIPQIFHQYGEEHFRLIERDIISKVASTEYSVISLGGGALGHHSSMGSILKSGKLIYLKAQAPTLEKRIEQGSPRPLLNHLSPEERSKKIIELLEKRTPLYEKAHLTIDTEDLEPTQVCFEVISRLGELA